MTYLEDNPPRVRQYREPRRAPVSGVIVMHTAESALDQIGADEGAENVARFIEQRTDPGSYHTLVDTDSRVRLVPFTAEAYGDRTGSNPHAVHISFACKAAGWARMTPWRRAKMIEKGAAAAVQAAKWIEQTEGVTVPARRITRAQSELREPGFIPHGDRDPERRTDPGKDFPWDAFLRAYERRMAIARYTEKIKRLRARIARLIEKRNNA
jgi:hypothetical protein